MYTQDNSFTSTVYESIIDSSFCIVFEEEFVVYKRKQLDLLTGEVVYYKVGKQRYVVSEDTLILGTLPSPLTYMISRGDSLFLFKNEEWGISFLVSKIDSEVIKESNYIEDVRKFPSSKSIIIE